MSCKYCRGNKKNKRLMSTDCDEINFDIYIGANSPILVALGSNFIDTSEVEINFCPMCGETLKQRLTPDQENAYNGSPRDSIGEKV